MKVAIAALFALASLIAISQEPPDWSKTYSVLPSQTLNIQNRRFHIVEIRTEYPVQLAAGPCHADSTVQWRCTFDDPADLFIRDLRVMPVFHQPRANAVVISGWERR